VTPKGHFTKDGDRRDTWGANLSRALWYSSKGSGGTAKEGRLAIAEFRALANSVRPGLFEGGRHAWASAAWQVTLPNGVTLGFVPDSGS
jgi:hypothetical protein